MTTTADKNLWSTCHFNNQKYKNLFSQARSSRFLYVGYYDKQFNQGGVTLSSKFKYNKNILGPFIREKVDAS